MVPDFIFIDLLGKFIVFADNIFSSAYSANYKLKIRNKNNVRIFYGKLHAHYIPKYVRLSEATTVTSSSADEIDVVILPPDDDQLSK